MMNKVSILGSDYSIEIHKVSEDKELKDNHWSGYCNAVIKKIVIADLTENEYFVFENDEEQELTKQQILRHEINHAWITEMNNGQYYFTEGQELGLNEIRIINLFSKVVNGKLSSKGLQIDENNLQYIDSLMQNKNFADFKFIVAWGTSMATSFACQKSKAEVLCLFKKYNPKGKIYQLSTNDDNISVDFAHPLYLGIRAKNSIWELENVKIKQNMLKLPEQKSNLLSVKEKELDY